MAYFETVGLLAPAFWPNSSLDNCILPAYIPACSLNGKKKIKTKNEPPHKKKELSFLLQEVLLCDDECFSTLEVAAFWETLLISSYFYCPLNKNFCGDDQPRRGNKAAELTRMELWCFMPTLS